MRANLLMGTNLLVLRFRPEAVPLDESSIQHKTHHVMHDVTVEKASDVGVVGSEWRRNRRREHLLFLGLLTSSSLLFHGNALLLTREVVEERIEASVKLTLQLVHALSLASHWRLPVMQTPKFISAQFINIQNKFCGRRKGRLT